MADAVNLIVERMLPELDDLERRGLFSRSEIRSIARQRTDFEYRLQRRSAPVRADHDAYLEFEKRLEALRQLRKKGVMRRMRRTGRQWKPSLSDRAGVRRIFFVYSRAVRKFRGDLRLWLEYLEFCRACGAHRQLQKVVGRALQLHPTVAGLWLYAAAYEFNHNANTVAARALLQRGLRMCGGSSSKAAAKEAANIGSESGGGVLPGSVREEGVVDLWVECLKLELANARKLKARRLVLMGTREEGRQGTEEVEGGVVRKGKGMEVKEEEDRMAVRLARAVVSRALEAMPLCLDLRLRLLDVLEEERGMAEVEGSAMEGEQRVKRTSAAAGDLRMDGEGKEQEGHGEEGEEEGDDDEEGEDSDAEDGGQSGVRGEEGTLASKVKLVGLSEVRSMVTADLDTRFGKSADAWEARARRALHGGPEEDDEEGEALAGHEQRRVAEAIEVFWAGVHALCNLDMCSRFSNFLVSLLDGRWDGDSHIGGAVASRVCRAMKQLLRFAAAADVPTAALVERYTSLLLRCGRLRSAAKAAAAVLAARQSSKEGLQAGGSSVAKWERGSEADLVGLVVLNNVLSGVLKGPVFEEEEDETDQAEGEEDEGRVAGDLTRNGGALASLDNRVWQAHCTDACGMSAWSHLYAVAYWEQKLQTCRKPKQVISLLQSLVSAAATTSSLPSAGVTGKQTEASTGAVVSDASAQHVQLLQQQRRRAVVTAVQCSAVTFALHRFSLEAARTVYKSVLAMPLSASKELFRHCIDLETAAADAAAATPGRDSQDELARGERAVRSLYELAVAVHGTTDAELWLSFCAFEDKAGKEGNAAMIYWRAKKALQDLALSQFLVQFRSSRVAAAAAAAAGTGQY